MNTPKVSIIVPCYKQAHFLDEALQSVLEQTYTHWECIIVNDGSPDNTEAIAQNWLKKDSRFKYFYKENGGLSVARNFAISQAKGEFILPLDADDKIGISYIKLALEEFQNNEFLKVVYSKAKKFGNETGEWILPNFSLEKLVLSNMIFCSGIFRREDWVRVGGYDENLIFGLEDWEFWISILKNGGGVKKLDYFGFYYRIKNESMIKLIDGEKKISYKKYILRKHAEFYLDTLNCFANELSKLEEMHQSEKFLLNELSFKLIGKRWFKIKE